MIVQVSNHAYARAKERLSWPRSAVDRMAERAYHEGIKPEDCTGRIRQYIEHKRRDYVFSIARIHGEYVYFYARSIPGVVLVTLYNIPHELVRLIPKRE